jgi:hypothetical protein
LPVTDEELLDGMRREFNALPGLRLTAAQAARMWGVEPETGRALLRRLTEARFLVSRADGTYVRADVALQLAPPSGPAAVSHWGAA